MYTAKNRLRLQIELADYNIFNATVLYEYCNLCVLSEFYRGRDLRYLYWRAYGLNHVREIWGLNLLSLDQLEIDSFK